MSDKQPCSKAVKGMLWSKLLCKHGFASGFPEHWVSEPFGPSCMSSEL